MHFRDSALANSACAGDSNPASRSFGSQGSAAPGIRCARIRVVLAAFGWALAAGSGLAQPNAEGPAEARPGAAPLLGLISDPAPLPEGRRWQMLTSGVKSPVNHVAWSPDGRWLAVATGHAVRLYEVTGVPELKRVLLGHEDSVRVARFSPDGTRIATASQDGTIRLWDQDGRLQAVFRAHEDSVQDVSWHPDGKRLASASLDGTVRLWNPDGNVTAVLSSHEAPVNAVAWRPDGRILASGCQNKTIRFWTPDGQPGPVLEGHIGAIQSLAWNSDGTRLLSGDHGIDFGDESKEAISHLKVWDAAGKLVSSANLAQPVTGVAWHPDGKEALAGGFFAVWTWPVADGKPVVRRGGGGQMTPVAWRPSGDLFAAGVNLIGAGGNVVSSLPIRPPEVHSVEQNPDGARLAVGGTTQTFSIFSRDGQQLHRSVATGSPTQQQISSIRWSPDGTTIIPGFRFIQALQRYDAEAKATGDPIPLPARSMRGLDLTRDGRFAACGGDGLTVMLIDLQTKSAVSLGRQAHGITQVRFTPDEQQVCSAGFDGFVRFWTRDGKPVKAFEAVSAPIRSMDWTSDGKQLVTGHEDNLIRFWNSDGTTAAVLGGHGGYVQALKFNPDNTLFASGSWDRAIRLWKRDGTPVSVLRGHAGSVFALQWTRDGKGLYSGGTDGVLRFWNPSTGRAEWQVLFGDTADYVTLDAHGRVLYGNEKLLESDFAFFSEDEQGRLVRTGWPAIRAAIGPAARAAE